MDEEREYPSRPTTESEVVAEAQRGKAAFDVAYPDENKHEAFIPFVARYKGPEPDAYDRIRAGVWFEAVRVLREKAEVALFGAASDGGIRFKWENVGDHIVLQDLSDLTVSMGGGRGRKEAVELGKSTPPIQGKSRWSWSRRE